MVGTLEHCVGSLYPTPKKGQLIAFLVPTEPLTLALGPGRVS